MLIIYMYLTISEKARELKECFLRNLLSKSALTVANPSIIRDNMKFTSIHPIVTVKEVNINGANSLLAVSILL